MPDANFRDPLGLAWRMIRSGDATARSVLLREGLGLATRPLDALLANREERRLRAADHEPGPTPCVLVVGGPRSGTTLVYQLLAQHLHVSYTSNWTGAFPRSPISAGKLRPRWVREPKASTRNFFGSVAGPGGPNDAFAVWDRWFGEVRGKPGPLSPESAAEVLAFVSAWNAAFGRPLLNKNNRNALAITSLAEALPGATFVVVERDPVYVAQSLLEARAMVQGDARHGWGLLCEEADPASAEGPVEAVCNQVRAFQREIGRQADALDPARLVRVAYKAFCRDPLPVLHAVATACPAAGPVRGTPPPLQSTDRRRIGVADFTGIERRLGGSERDRRQRGSDA